MSYITVCPHCGHDSLHVVALAATCRIPLTDDGFCELDARDFNSEDEIVGCEECGTRWDLGELDLYFLDASGISPFDFVFYDPGTGTFWNEEARTWGLLDTATRFDYCDVADPPWAVVPPLRLRPPEALGASKET